MEEITPEELAALELHVEENGLVEKWEYYTVYRKRGQKHLTVNPGGYSPFGLRRDGKIIRRKKVIAYGEYEVVRYDETNDPIEDDLAHALVRYLVNLDDPEWADERAKVTLNDLIAKAKAIQEDLDV